MQHYPGVVDEERLTAGLRQHVGWYRVCARFGYICGRGCGYVITCIAVSTGPGTVDRVIVHMHALGRIAGSVRRQQPAVDILIPEVCLHTGQTGRSGNNSRSGREQTNILAAGDRRNAAGTVNEEIAVRCIQLGTVS